MNVSEVGFLISKIHQLSGRIFNKLLKDNDIEFNSAQGRILFVLWKTDEIPIKELSNKTLLGKSTLTSMLDRLEEQGHITRLSSKEDRRATIIKLTEENKRQKEKYGLVSRQMSDFYYTGFTPEEIQDFEAYLNRVQENLRKLRKS